MDLSFADFFRAAQKNAPIDEYEYNRSVRELADEIMHSWSTGNSDEVTRSFVPDRIHAELHQENEAQYFDRENDLTNEGGERYAELEELYAMDAAKSEIRPQRKEISARKPQDVADQLAAFFEANGMDVTPISGSGKSGSQYFGVITNGKRIDIRVSDHHLPVEYESAHEDLVLADISSDEVRADGRNKSVGIDEDETLQRANDFAVGLLGKYREVTSPSYSSVIEAGTPVIGMQERPAVRADESGSLEELAQSGGDGRGDANISQQTGRRKQGEATSRNNHEGEIKMNTPVDVTQEDATEALFEAIRKDDINGFQAALAAGALVDAPNLVGDYPLHLVAENGNQEMFGRLRRMGADADVSDGQGWLPVHRAVRAGQPEMAQALMEYSAALNAELDMEGAPEAGRNDSEATGEWKGFGDVEKAIKVASSVEELVSAVEKADALYMRDEDPLQVSDEEWKRLTQLVAEKKNELDGNVENTIRPAVGTEVSAPPPQQSAEAKADFIAPVKKSLLEQTTPAATQRPKTLLGGKFIGDDKGNYRRIGEENVSLVDEVERIRFIDKQMDTFQAAVELAKHKGWNAIEVTGSDRFRAEAWYVAHKAGLEVVGYEPTTKDLARLGEGVATDVPNLVIASRKEAERVALAKVGAVQGVDENVGRYVGKVIHETDHHIVQDVGHGMSAIHDKGKFPATALREFGSPKPLRIQYRAGMATVDATKQQERGATR